MIESDCKIPTDYQPIAQPETYPLHGIPLAVKQMLDKGYTRWEIHKKLRISDDDYRDAIFEIRKQEAIMGKRLSEEKRAQIIALRESGKSYEEVAEACEVSRNAVYHAVKAAGLVGQADEPIIMTEEHTAAPPDVVRKAVLYRIADIDDECNAAEAKINALREKIHELTKERGELEIWMEEVKRDESD